MTIFLREATASQEIPLGYFVDSTDGNTEETGLTINNTDIKIWKAGATTLANKNSGGGTHISNGVYYATLDATDTNTVGSLVIFVHVSGALTIRLECAVLPANIYDSLFAGTDVLDVSVTQWLGTAAATPTTAGVPEVDITHIAGSAVSTTTAQLGVNVVQVSGDATSADNLELDYDGTGYNKTNSTIGTCTTNTDLVTAAAVRTEMDANSTQLAAIVADTNELQTDDMPGLIAALNNISTAQVNTEVDTALSDIGLDHLLAATVAGTDITDNSIIAKLVSKSVTADWDDFVNTTDSLQAIRDEQTVIETDTNELQGDWTDGGRLDLIVDAILADTNELQTDDIPGTIAALNNISAAEVNAEVVDVMRTDTLTATPQAAPPTTPTIEEALMVIYDALIHRVDVTSSQKSFYNNAGTVIWKKALSDDTTTYTEAESASGP